MVGSIVKGDALSISISAASIVAKVTRDRIMVELDAQYPDQHEVPVITLVGNGIAVLAVAQFRAVGRGQGQHALGALALGFREFNFVDTAAAGAAAATSVTVVVDCREGVDSDGQVGGSGSLHVKALNRRGCVGGCQAGGG